MAVSKQVNFIGNDSTIYVPHRGVSRTGIVGTYAYRATAAGDVSGGGVDHILKMQGDELGFPALLVPTLFGARDNLATAEDVLVSMLSNNERIPANLERRIQMGVADGLNTGELQGSYIPVEFDSESSENMWQWGWATNTDGKTYAAFMFAVVYDRQAMARETDLRLEGPLAGPL